MKWCDFLVCAGLSVACITTSFGQDAAPSSHLKFDDSFEGDILINEVRVPADGEALHTYYETLGWQGKAGGYAGIQAHPRNHNFIFSIWDNESHTAPIRAVYQGGGTEVEKFGGEGTGLKSWNFELGWDQDEWYALVSRCWPEGEHTLYGFWARSEKTGEWTHLVTMDVAAENAFFQGGTDAFIEDWLETGKEARTIHLRSGWKRNLDGEWHAFGTGRYSVNAWDLEGEGRSVNFKESWNGGVGEDATGKYYFMTAGGSSTKPETDNPSEFSIKRKEKEPGYDPIQVQNLKGAMGANREATVTWETNPETLPQFSFSLVVHDNDSGRGEAIAEVTETNSEARKATLSLPEVPSGRRLYFRLRCRDILDHQTDDLVNP